ncbi:MAG: RNA methyltransferase [Flavobacteriales bacterium]|uniref:RNA methyltransferase n=1 Tax=Blattabacterium sp. (Mastotermes darwiniensis) TaxID=39768 RepID=UPI001EE54BD8|nr:RNA methyltransferase [Blattabacterium sp. (Mastotermes darwiniensis)]MDR1804944.1 RNA methyltransferase [Flavobacteriales bacterium]
MKIKKLIKINKKNNKKIFLVEGIKEFEMAIKGNFFPIEIFICKNIFHQYNMIKSFNDIVCFINIKAFQKFSCRKNSGGIIALFKKEVSNNLRNIKVPKNPFILVLDGIEKPGNLGSILRTADAAGVHFIILCNTKTYIFNPNVIRCSLGCVFTKKIFVEEIKSIIAWLQENKIEIAVTGFHKKKSIELYQTQFSSHLAIVLGSESKGVSKIWLKIAHKIITIPMFGNIDSMNVSNATSIIIYEVIRQRKLHNFS